MKSVLLFLLVMCVLWVAPVVKPFDANGQVQAQGVQLGSAALDSLDQGDEELEALKLKPMKYWRKWAEHPPKPVPFFLFTLLSSLVSWTIMRRVLRDAQQNCAGSFWKSLLVGVITATLIIVIARCLFISKIGLPLGILSIGFLQLGILMGLASSADLLGEAAIVRTGLSKSPWLSDHPLARRMTTVSVGLILPALLLLIPPIAQFPPIGIKIVAAIAVWGMGGVVSALARTQGTN